MLAGRTTARLLDRCSDLKGQGSEQTRDRSPEGRFQTIHQSWDAALNICCIEMPEAKRNAKKRTENTNTGQNRGRDLRSLRRVSEQMKENAKSKDTANKYQRPYRKLFQHHNT